VPDRERLKTLSFPVRIVVSVVSLVGTLVVDYQNGMKACRKVLQLEKGCFQGGGVVSTVVCCFDKQRDRRPLLLETITKIRTGSFSCATID
jgi:hypothetical protein